MRTPQLSVVRDPAPAAPVDRDQTIAAIRAALRRRSGKSWSVRGGRGTTWGWITVSAPPRRCDKYGHMGEEDRVELAALLDIDANRIGGDGAKIAASWDYRREYIARAEGRRPEVIATPYWD
ncbi:MAG: hypothetical protein AB7G47_19330 [Mycolicibacterium sp.]|uniref:hypothetical protein n=1 Tax=Mycolicibacterium sp. TaxID=2320850 RepID=UPI003D132837